MDATRFASTNVLKALHDDRQKQDRARCATRRCKQCSRFRRRRRRRSPKIEDVDRSALPRRCSLVVTAVGYSMLQLRRAVHNRAGCGGRRVASRDRRALERAASGSAAAARGGGSAPTPAAPAGCRPKHQLRPSAAPIVRRATRRSKKKSAPPAATRAPPQPVAPAPAPPPVRRARRTWRSRCPAPYPFEVLDGSRLIVRRRHDRTNCRRSRTARRSALVAAEVFLDHAGQGGRRRRPAIRVHARRASAASRFAPRAASARRWSASSDLGYGPWPTVRTPWPASYRVTLVCPDGQNPACSTTGDPGLPCARDFPSEVITP